MVSTNQYDVTYKVLVLGESNVGKTSIIHRFTNLEYQDTFISTIGIDSCTKIIEINGEKIRLQIWDTAGQERFRTLTSAYYRGATGIILVYDVTAEYTFSNISNWIQAIVENASPGVCQLLVANKIDSPKWSWTVPTEKGAERAAEANLQFFETSAKEGIGVEEAFLSMAALIQTKKRQEEKMNGSNAQGTVDLSLTPRSSNTASSRCC